MTREEAARIINECKNEGFKYTLYTLEEYHMALDIAIKALEQERSMSAEITQYRHECKKLMEENERLKKALEQQPCTDAISREMALDCDMGVRLNKSVLNQYPVGEYDYENLRRACFYGIELAKHEMEGYLIDLPSVTPQPKTGYWTIKQYQVPIENKQVPTVSGITFPTEPTACKIVYTYTHRACKSKKYLNKYNYCPNCGAKMQEVEE